MPTLPKRKGPQKGKPRTQPSEKQAKFVEATLKGLSATAAAVAAGAAPGAGHAMINSATIKHELSVARNWLTDTTQITRLNTIEGIIDGIEMARMMGDPGNVIKGWCEIAKILGHYAPEKKQIDLTIHQQALRSKFEAMSDEQLMALAAGRTIEGEVIRETH